jgi:fatty acid desaturase
MATDSETVQESPRTASVLWRYWQCTFLHHRWQTAGHVSISMRVSDQPWMPYRKQFGSRNNRRTPLDPDSQPLPGTELARSVAELTITVLPLVALWSMAWFVFSLGHWWASQTVPTAGFLLRLYMIQHDCGHGAFFSRKRANDWLGRVIGVFTLTPYDYWRHTHAIHHATSGNLDRRGIGDVDTLTG